MTIPFAVDFMKISIVTRCGDGFVIDFYDGFVVGQLSIDFWSIDSRCPDFSSLSFCLWFGVLLRFLRGSFLFFLLGKNGKQHRLRNLLRLQRSRVDCWNYFLKLKYYLLLHTKHQYLRWAK